MLYEPQLDSLLIFGPHMRNTGCFEVIHHLVIDIGSLINLASQTWGSNILNMHQS